MSRWMQPLVWMWDWVFASVPRAGVSVARWLYFWGLVARSFMVRKGVLRRKRVALHRPPLPAAPAAPSARPVRYPITAVGRA